MSFIHSFLKKGKNYFIEMSVSEAYFCLINAQNTNNTSILLMINLFSVATTFVTIPINCKCDGGKMFR